MSQYASKDDMIGAMRKRIAELESELEAVGAGGETTGATDMTTQQPEALRRSTAADGKTELFNLPGYPLMVRAVDFNRIHSVSEMRRAALLDEMQKAALAAGQAVVQDDLITIRKPTTQAEVVWLAKLAHLLVSDVNYTLGAMLEPKADSVPAVSDLPPLPAPDLRDVGTKPQEIKEFLKGYATEYARTAIAARASLSASAGSEPAAGPDPVAYLYDDGSWTPAKTEEGRKLSNWMISAGSPKIGVLLASAAQPTRAVQPTHSRMP